MINKGDLTLQLSNADSKRLEFFVIKASGFLIENNSKLLFFCLKRIKVKCSQQAFSNSLLMRQFLKNNGLLKLGYDKESTEEYIDKLASLICWTLYDTNCINILPETIGIAKYSTGE